MTFTEERFTSIREESLNRIIDIARNTEGRDYFSANKYLLEGGWYLDDKVGRPSKEAILREAKNLVDQSKEIQEDYTRIMKN